MTETQTPQTASNEAQPTFEVRRIYLKDASLEMPNAPEVFLVQDEPKVHIEIFTEQKELGNNTYDVSVNVTATAKYDEKTLFLVEAKQAGIFEIHNLEQEQLNGVLHVVCPTMLFPYLRANVSDLLTRATLPPLYLAEVNFEQLHRKQVEQAKAIKQ